MRPKSFTPLEKPADFNRRSLSPKADSSLRPLSEQSVRELRSLTGFTLIEILVVIIIIGVLSTLGYVNYVPIREQNFDKEAQANLRLILAAERIYRTEFGVYWPSASNGNINTDLKLLLPTANPRWNYRTTVGGASPTCAEATRTAGSNPRSPWRLRSTDTDLVPNASCP